MKRKFDEMCTKLYVKLQFAKSEARDTISNEEGSAVEYALVIAVIVCGVIAASAAFYEPLGEFFTEVKNRLMEFF